jgi:phosphonate transport system substrate-binding protein
MKNNKKATAHSPIIKKIIPVLTALVLLLALTTNANSTTYTFGIVPQQSATKLARSWIPLIKHLERESGLKIKFATAPNIPEFENRLRKGLYDFAYMNPYHYTVFHKTTGYEAFARQLDKQIKGIIVIHQNSEIKSITDLNNQQIAFPAPAAFAATLLVKSHLQNNKVNFTSKYVASHDSVYRAVAKELTSAGGGIMRTFNNVAPEIREQLKIFWTSKDYTPHAFAYHPRVNKNIVKHLFNALLTLNNDENKPLLKKINFNGFEAAVDTDWDDVRSLSIDELDKSKSAEDN